MNNPPMTTTPTGEQASPDEPVEQIAPGLTRQWMADHQIVIFKISSVAREVVDAWIGCVKSTMENWPANLPYLAIHDMTSDKVSLTPYARSRAEELIPLSAKAPGYAAILMSQSFVAQLIRLFIRTQRRQGNQNEVFFSMQDALAWLEPKMGKRAPDHMEDHMEVPPAKSQRLM